MQIPQEYTIPIAAFAAAFGLIQCFFGYRAFRIILAVVGFAVGFTAGAAAAGPFTPDQNMVLLAAILGGVAGALLFSLLYFVGVFFMGMVLGALACSVTMELLAMDPEPIAILVAALVAGGLALWLQRVLIILSTAFSGSAQAIAGAILILGGVSDQDTSVFVRPEGTLALIMAGVWAGLALLGIFVQFRTPPPAHDTGDAGKKTVLR